MQNLFIIGCLKNDHIFYNGPKWAIFQHNSLIKIDKNCLVSFFINQKVD